MEEVPDVLWRKYAGSDRHEKIPSRACLRGKGEEKQGKLIFSEVPGKYSLVAQPVQLPNETRDMPVSKELPKDICAKKRHWSCSFRQLGHPQANSQHGLDSNNPLFFSAVK